MHEVHFTPEMYRKLTASWPTPKFHITWYDNSPDSTISCLCTHTVSCSHLAVMLHFTLEKVFTKQNATNCFLYLTSYKNCGLSLPQKFIWSQWWHSQTQKIKLWKRSGLQWYDIHTEFYKIHSSQDPSSVIQSWRYCKHHLLYKHTKIRYNITA